MTNAEKDICPWCCEVEEHKVLDEYMCGYDYVYKMKCVKCGCIYETVFKLTYKKQNVMKKGE